MRCGVYTIHTHFILSPFGSLLQYFAWSFFSMLIFCFVFSFTPFSVRLQSSPFFQAVFHSYTKRNHHKACACVVSLWISTVSLSSSSTSLSSSSSMALSTLYEKLYRFRCTNKNCNSSNRFINCEHVALVGGFVHTRSIESILFSTWSMKFNGKFQTHPTE